VSINPTSGLISGRPSRTGRSRVTVTAGDAYANSASVSFTWKIVKPGKPKVTGASLKGAAAGHPKLSFTLHQGSHAPRLHSVTVSLPRGLTFRHSLRHRITVRNGRHKLRFSAHVSHGRLTVTLRSGQAKATITVTAVRGSHRGRLSGRIAITDTSRHRTRLTVHFRG
jgi:hypothetical protein